MSGRARNWSGVSVKGVRRHRLVWVGSRDVGRWRIREACFDGVGDIFPMIGVSVASRRYGSKAI